MEISKVLIAEDEAIIALDIKTILEANSFIVIGTSRTFNGVARLIKENSPDLLISSLHLNKESGYFDKILHLQKEYKLKVLFLSALASLSKYKSRGDANHLHFLKKPFTADELLKAVNALQLNAKT